MDLFSQLHKLQSIKPNPSFARDSRDFILRTTPHQSTPVIATHRFSFVSFLFDNLQVGSAMALTGLIILFFFGGPSLMQFLFPLQSSSLNQSSLSAEAQAIDIQIKLADLSYAESPLSSAKKNARVISSATPHSSLFNLATLSQSTTTTSTTAFGTTTTTEPSIDEALAQIAQ